MEKCPTLFSLVGIEYPRSAVGIGCRDGSYFVFQATRDGKTEIWAIRERRGLPFSSSQPVRLTAGQMNSLAPMVSPNGKKLYVIGEQLRGELVRYDARSGEFVPYLSGISAEFVDFSRDGKWVTYVNFPDRILWRSRFDGTERLQLTSPPVQATMPRWSPDGKRIAYFDAAPGKPWEIYLISAEGGKPEPLLNEPRNQMDPNWSPDGNSVIFSYFPLFDRVPPEKLGVYMVDLKTRNVKKLRGSDGLWVPRWSNDGAHIVARSADSQSLMLFEFRHPDMVGIGQGRLRRACELVGGWPVCFLRAARRAACPLTRSDSGPKGARNRESEGFAPDRISRRDLDRPDTG